MDTNRFASDRIVERYRRLACAAISGTERMRLLGLMAEEEDKYLVPQNVGSPLCGVRAFPPLPRSNA
jgi:hypothetical protein